MNLLIVVIEDPENLEDFLSVLVDLDVTGLQVLDSTSVMGILARETPIFAGLRQLVSRPKADSKIVFGLTEREDILELADRKLQKIELGLNESGSGYAILMPILGKTGQLEF